MVEQLITLLSGFGSLKEFVVWVLSLFARTLRRRIKFLILALVVIALSMAAKYFTSRTYEGSVTVAVVPIPRPDGTAVRVGELPEWADFFSALAKSNRDALLADAARLAGIPPVQPAELTIEQDGALIIFQVRAQNSAHAAILPEKVADSFLIFVRDVTPASIAFRSNAVRTQRLLDWLAYARTGAFLFGLAFVIGVFLEIYSDAFPKIEKVANDLKVPILGYVADVKSLRRREAKRGYGYEPDGYKNKPPGEQRVELVTFNFPLSMAAEQFRTIYTRLTRDVAQRIILISSTFSAEGKSTLVANLATAATFRNYRVLIVDCDLRRPRQHEIFGVSNTVGLTGFLQGVSTLQEVIQPTSVIHLSLIPCGPIPPNPVELLTSNRMDGLLKAASEYFDFLILDSPPAVGIDVELSDVEILASKADGCVISFDSKAVNPIDLTRTIRNLRKCGATVLGISVNRHSSRG